MAITISLETPIEFNGIHLLSRMDFYHNTAGFVAIVIRCSNGDFYAASVDVTGDVRNAIDDKCPNHIGGLKGTAMLVYKKAISYDQIEDVSC